MGRMNGKDEDSESYLWTCPGCRVTYINSEYCYTCDIRAQDEESESEK